jgi:class 3 adenylate cyclase/TolA-binding protein
MTDLTKMERTWLCSVVFMDIVKYSTQSVELQMKWKKRFNGYLSEAIQDVPESERVILDTGDGAAICFLGAPEAAMFAALHLWQCFVRDEKEQQPGLLVRIGVNLGPVKLIKDVNGSLNAIGDGINAGQRIMSFAPANQILVSQSFFEVVSRLSDDYKQLFELKGVETDKHIREHTVYRLFPPGSEKQQDPVVSEALKAPPIAVLSPPAPVSTAASPQDSTPKRSPSRALPLFVGGAVVFALAAAGAWHFFKSVSSATPVNTATVQQNQSPQLTSAIAPSAAVPAPAGVAPSGKSVPSEQRDQKSTTPAVTAPTKNPAKSAAEPAAAAKGESPAAGAGPDDTTSGTDHSTLYDQATHLLEQGKLPEAIARFDDVIRRNPSYALAYENRGNAYSGLQQYDRALQDYSQAITIRPKNVDFYLNRATAYSNLKQYDKAIQDYTTIIGFQPKAVRAYMGRAVAERMSGDGAAAAADRRLARDLRSNSSTEQ